MVRIQNRVWNGRVKWTCRTGSYAAWGLACGDTGNTGSSSRASLSGKLKAFGSKIKEKSKETVQLGKQGMAAIPAISARPPCAPLNTKMGACCIAVLLDEPRERREERRSERRSGTSNSALQQSAAAAVAAVEQRLRGRVVHDVQESLRRLASERFVVRVVPAPHVGPALGGGP